MPRERPEPRDARRDRPRALVSLACKYRLVLERLERTTGREVDVVHVIGGGAQAELLCRLTADVLGRRVLAGPVEATALGNVLVQARAAGELGSLHDIRAGPPRPSRPDGTSPPRRGDPSYVTDLTDAFAYPRTGGVRGAVRW